jgi:hypothetical protein
MIGFDPRPVQDALVGSRDRLLVEDAELIAAVLPAQSSHDVGPFVALREGRTRDEKCKKGERL